MANPVWPASLPQYLETDGFTMKLPDRVVRTRTDAGPGKARPRFTAAPTPVKGTVLVDATQLAALRTFHDSTLAGGALRFDWVDPIARSAATFRFKSPPDVAPMGMGGAGLALVKVTLDLEIVP